MARLLTIDGVGSFEINGNSGGTYTTTNARTGSCYSVSGLATGTSQRCRAAWASGPVKGPFFFRIYLRVGTLPSTEMRFAYLSNTTVQDTGVSVYLTIDAAGLIRLYDEDGIIGSPSSAVSTGQYYRIEWEVNTAGAAGAHSVRARIDGTEFAAADDRSISIDCNNLYYGGNLHLEANTAGAFTFDDIAVNDGLGQYSQGYPGNGNYYLLKPNAAGDNNAWTGDYTALDELPPNDGTDFQSSNMLNAIIDHNIEDTPAAILSTDIIKVVHVHARYAGAGASANATAVVRCKAAAADTVEESVTLLSANNVTWRTNDPNNSVPIARLTLYDLPGPIGTYWTKALIDTAQIGARINAASTNALQISALWMGVESSDVPRTVRDPSRMMMAAL